MKILFTSYLEHICTELSILYPLFYMCWNISRTACVQEITCFSFAPILAQLLTFGFKNLYTGFSKRLMP